MFVRSILAIATALHRAATKLRIKAHDVAVIEAKVKINRAHSKADKAYEAFVAMQYEVDAAEREARLTNSEQDGVINAQLRTIAHLENPAL